MPTHRSTGDRLTGGSAVIDEKILQRIILDKIGHELAARSEIKKELPRDLLALVKRIECGRPEDE